MRVQARRWHASPARTFSVSRLYKTWMGPFDE